MSKPISIEQMRAERLSYIGASDVGGLLLDQDGHPIHPYKTPHSVWLDKKGLTEFEDNERTVMGQLLEPLIAKRFQLLNTGVKLRRTGTHKGKESFHACNPDRLIVQRVTQIPGTILVQPDKKGLKAILQLKSAGFFGAKGFGDQGTDEVPDWYVAQVQWEMYCTGADLCVLGLLHDTHLYSQFIIYRDQTLIDQLVSIVNAFWKNYVESGIEPPVTGHDKDKDWLKDAWEPKNDDLIVATEELDNDVEKLVNELPKLERLTNIVEGRKSRIKAFMGKNGRLGTSYGQITWKANKNGTRSLNLAGVKKTNSEVAA